MVIEKLSTNSSIQSTLSSS